MAQRVENLLDEGPEVIWGDLPGSAGEMVAGRGKQPVDQVHADRIARVPGPQHHPPGPAT